MAKLDWLHGRPARTSTGTDLGGRSARGSVFASLGAVAAAFLASLCCAGPLLFVTFGVGAGLASTFEPLRPVFGVLMAGGLAIGFYTVYGRRPKVPGAAADAEVRQAPREGVQRRAARAAGQGTPLERHDPRPTLWFA